MSVDLWRVASNKFICGIHVEKGRVKHAPPYCRFLKGWTLKKIKKEALKSDWTVMKITLPKKMQIRPKDEAQTRLCLDMYGCPSSTEIPEILRAMATCANKRAFRVEEKRDVRDWTRVERILIQAADKVGEIEARINA